MISFDIAGENSEACSHLFTAERSEDKAGTVTSFVLNLTDYVVGGNSFLILLGAKYGNYLPLVFPFSRLKFSIKAVHVSA